MIDMLKSMAIFSEVARLGSFRAAAKSQNVSPSVISRHISNLEGNLGEVLLSRSTRKLSLTSVGEEFLCHCDQMIESANRGLISVKENINEGHLRVTLPITLITTEFGELIRIFRNKNPKVDFSLVFDDDYIDIIGDGVDLALRLGPLEDSNLKSKRIAIVNRSIVCTPDYFAKVGKPSSPEDLSRCNWIGRKNPAMIPVMYSPSGEKHTVPEQAKFTRVNNILAIKALVLSQNGIGLFSDMLVEKELANGQLVRLLPEWQVESMHMYAVWSANKTTGLLVKKFVDFLAEELEEL